MREFLETELKIRVEVPALELLPDGSIHGGPPPPSSSPPLGDVLSSHTNLADTDPNVIIGPDSIGTLSFTLGSAGIPKGAKG